MRKFMRFPPRTLRFRSLLILAGAFALLAAFAPCANSALLRFYDFEGPAIIVNQGSHQPALSRATFRRSLCSSKMTMALRIPTRISQPKTGLSLELQICLPAPSRTRPALVSTVQGKLI